MEWASNNVSFFFVILLVSGAIGSFVAIRENAAMRESGGLFQYLAQNYKKKYCAKIFILALIFFQVSVVTLSAISIWRK